MNECTATHPDGGYTCTGLPDRHSGRHLAWTGGPVGQRKPIMWHDDRTREQTERMKQLLDDALSASPR